VSLELDSYINSVMTKYKFSVVATVPVNSGNAIKITLPAESGPPEEPIACSPEGESPVISLQCQPVADDPLSVVAVLDLSRPITSLETFSFSVDGVHNPVSTRPTGDLAIQLLKSEGSTDILNEIKTGLQVITSIPFFVDPT